MIVNQCSGSEGIGSIGGDTWLDCESQKAKELKVIYIERRNMVETNIDGVERRTRK